FVREHFRGAPVRRMALKESNQRPKLVVVRGVLSGSCWRTLRPSVKRGILKPSLYLFFDVDQGCCASDSEIAAQRFSVGVKRQLRARTLQRRCESRQFIGAGMVDYAFAKLSPH